MQMRGRGQDNVWTCARKKAGRKETRPKKLNENTVMDTRDGIHQKSHPINPHPTANRIPTPITLVLDTISRKTHSIH